MQRFIEPIWNSWQPLQKELFVLKYCGSDTPIMRITASLDSISAYSVTSKATKKALKAYFAIQNKALLIDFVNWCKNSHIMPILHQDIEETINEYLEGNFISSLHNE